MDSRTEVPLAADGCLIYRSIKTIRDQVQFQEDLNVLQIGGQSRGIRLNARKCNIMTITNKEDPLTKFYWIDITILAQVDFATYLGILIHKLLKLSEHVYATTTMCSQSLGFLRRNRKQCPKELRTTANLILVCSCSEHSTMIWDPHLAKGTCMYNILNKEVMIDL